MRVTAVTGEPNTTAYEEVIALLKAGGIGPATARILLDTAIEESMSNAASTGADFTKVRAIVGEHSVMLHSLILAISSLSNLNSLHDEPIQPWEILRMLADWAKEMQAGIGNANPDETG